MQMRTIQEKDDTQILKLDQTGWTAYTCPVHKIQGRSNYTDFVLTEIDGQKAGDTYYNLVPLEQNARHSKQLKIDTHYDNDLIYRKEL